MKRLLFDDSRCRRKLSGGSVLNFDDVQENQQPTSTLFCNCRSCLVAVAEYWWRLLKLDRLHDASVIEISSTPSHKEVLCLQLLLHFVFYI